MKNFFLILTRLVLSLLMGLLFYVLLCRTFISAEVLEAQLPVHPVHWAVSTFYPNVVVDGEIAQDVLMGDALVIYGGVLSVLCWLMLGSVGWLQLSKAPQNAR